MTHPRPGTLSGQLHLHPILVVIQFLEGIGRQLLFPPDLGSSLLLCGGGHSVTLYHKRPNPITPKTCTESHCESSLTLRAGDTTLDLTKICVLWREDDSVAR